jgi:pimeloyl-ACP methyl ester carboxylesterase
MYFELDPVMEAGRPNPREDNDTFDGIFTAIGCPVLLIRGAVENGGIMSDEEAERVVGLIPDSRDLSWPRVGHSPHIARNHDFIRTVKRFWSE